MRYLCRSQDYDHDHQRRVQQALVVAAVHSQLHVTTMRINQLGQQQTASQPFERDQ